MEVAVRQRQVQYRGQVYAGDAELAKVLRIPVEEVRRRVASRSDLYRHYQRPKADGVKTWTSSN